MQRGLEGAWIPVAANVAGRSLIVNELRVKYLVGKERPSDMQAREDQLLLSITYARALALLS